MAAGAAARLRADVGIGTTGVAGPDPHDGEPVGSVWIAVVAPDGAAARHLALAGDRAAIRVRPSRHAGTWSWTRWSSDAGTGE